MLEIFFSLIIRVNRHKGHQNYLQYNSFYASFSSKNIVVESEKFGYTQSSVAWWRHLQSDISLATHTKPYDILLSNKRSPEKVLIIAIGNSGLFCIECSERESASNKIVLNKRTNS